MTETLTVPALTLRPVASADKAALAQLFAALVTHGDARFFEPHPMTDADAARVAAYSGKDVYVVAEEAGSFLGYGVLRGWDEGLVIPSLGIAVHPEARGARLGRLLIHYLHTIAYRRGAERVRVRVHVENASAITLYQSVGYEFGGRSGENLLASCSLANPKNADAR